MKFNKKLSLMYVPHWVWMFLNELCEETDLKKIIKYMAINRVLS